MVRCRTYCAGYVCDPVALSVHPANTQRFFILRSKVAMAEGLWEDAVEDANEASFILSRKFIHANVIIRR